jgi:VWFA-related protein
MAAVYEITPFLSSISTFTDDAVLLGDAIDRVRYFPGESLGRSVTEESLYRGALGTRAQSVERLLNASQFAGSLMAAERRQFYESLESLAEVLQAVSGRKILVFLSGGFPMMTSREEMATGGFTIEFKRMIQKLQRAEVTVFSLDIGEDRQGIDLSRGQHFGIAMDELGLGPDFLDRVGLGQSMGGETGTSYNQILAVLANESGGRFLPGRDYGRSLAEVSEHTKHFYLIGYRPVREKEPDGQGRKIVREHYRPISVSVDLKGARVSTRKGRIATEQPVLRAASIRKQPAPSAAGKPAAHRLRCTPVAFPASGTRVLLSIPMVLDGGVSPIEVPGGGLVLDLSTRVSVRAGEYVVTSRDRSYRVTLKPGAREALSRGIRMMEAVELPPGLFDVEVRLRLNGLGVDVSWEDKVEAVPGTADDLALSGLALVADGDSPPLVADAFTMPASEEGGEPPRPPFDPYLLPDGRRVPAVPYPVFEPSSPLMIFFRVYDAATDETDGPQELDLDYELLPEDGAYAIIPPLQPVYMKRTRDGGSLDVISRIDLAAVLPGTYTLRVQARTGSRRVVASQRMEVVSTR